MCVCFVHALCVGAYVYVLFMHCVCLGVCPFVGVVNTFCVCVCVGEECASSGT